MAADRGPTTVAVDVAQALGVNSPASYWPGSMTWGALRPTASYREFGQSRSEHPDMPKVARPNAANTWVLPGSPEMPQLHDCLDLSLPMRTHELKKGMFGRVVGHGQSVLERRPKPFGMLVMRSAWFGHTGELLQPLTGGISRPESSLQMHSHPVKSSPLRLKA